MAMKVSRRAGDVSPPVSTHPWLIQRTGRLTPATASRRCPARPELGLTTSNEFPTPPPATWGGGSMGGIAAFGSAPKFPHSMDLQLLLRLWKRQATLDRGPGTLDREHLLAMVTLTLDKMAAGGIYDHLAGGFARYSVDERWLVPHFEKMLYDNALLTSAYLDAYLVTREERFARVARETCNYILTYMTDAAGGFHSTEDADSEGRSEERRVGKECRSR